MMGVGLDVHKLSLSAVAVDELGRPLQEYAGPVDEGVLAWTRALDEERLWGARGLPSRHARARASAGRSRRAARPGVASADGAAAPP